MIKPHHIMVEPHYIMIKPHHIMTKPHHIMTKPHHIMTKPHHIMMHQNYNMTKLHHITTKHQHIMIIDHIRKLWLSIESHCSRVGKQEEGLMGALKHLAFVDCGFSNYDHPSKQMSIITQNSFCVFLPCHLLGFR